MIVKPGGSFLDRLARGTRWTWLSDDYRAALPEDFERTVMEWVTPDRFHAKQGRSTARVRFDSPWGELSVYLKRHDRLPLWTRLGALLWPGIGRSPASAEWRHLDFARSLGIAVPEVVAAGERIGPWTNLSGFLMVAELTGAKALNEALPEFAARLTVAEFAALKRTLIAEMVAIAVRLHAASTFHKDFYLCHFFLETSADSRNRERLTLIDLHRLGVHRWNAARWRRKDLAQLLFSTFDVPVVDDRDRARFWLAYRKAMKLRSPRRERSLIRAKAEKYRLHNAKSR